MEITLLAGRNINLLVGIFTLTATWVGGGFILGIAEATYNPTLGAVWALMPVPYVVTFFLGEWYPLMKQEQREQQQDVCNASTKHSKHALGRVCLVMQVFFT